MSIFKKILKIIISIVVVVGFIFLAQWVKENQKLIFNKIQRVVDVPLISQPVSEKELPPNAEPKEVSYTWQYAGKSYSLKETLYGSTFAFYQESPKAYKYQGVLPANWENDYYGMFFMTTKGDNFISQIANDLQALGKKNKLSDDQIVEMILAFVQKLTYDDARANAILSGGQESIYYPYETLFLQSGVCSDKSILAAKIFQSLGYGTALFTYEAEKHMALGIKCPQEYSNNNSGYCYAETTSVGFRIGMIPDFDQNNRVVANQELKTFEQTQVEQFNVKRLGEPKIFQTTEGKIYNGITRTLSLAREIDSLKLTIQKLGREISNFRKNIDNQQSELEDLISKMNRLKKSGNYEEYNDQVDKYNDLADDYKASVKKYNAMIKDYNQKITRYNSLIKSF